VQEQKALKEQAEAKVVSSGSAGASAAPGVPSPTVVDAVGSTVAATA
jgi:hypothetical protein